MRLFYSQIILAIAVTGCSKQDDALLDPLPDAPHVFAHPAADVPAEPPLALPTPPGLTGQGQQLILEYETGGERDYNRSPYPEAPDARYSGVTIGVGYDLSTNSQTVITGDWQELGDANTKRLAATHGYTGKSAQAHLHEVRDILIRWKTALGVFEAVDVARTFALCRKTFPGFDDLRPNAQAALVSLVFNRGNAMNGANRSEMREIRDLVPRRDYEGIAAQFRAMVRVWRGTSIEHGMTRRRYAESQLVLTP